MSKLYERASLVVQMVKNLPVMQETWVRSLGQENRLEKGLASTPALLPGEFHEQRSLVDYSLWGCKESDTTERLYFNFHSHTYQRKECWFL